MAIKNDDKDLKAGVKLADDTDAGRVPPAKAAPAKAKDADDVPAGEEPRKDADGTVASPPDTEPSPTPFIPGGIPGNNGPI